MKSSKKRDAGSRVVLYARVSTEEQAGEDHFSIDAQFNEMREYANAREWEIVGEFVDDGYSGSLRDRPHLSMALHMVANKECDVLLVHELSRLSRSVYHTLDIFDKIGNKQVGFASVRDPDFDFADPGKRLFLTIIAAINEYYIVLLKQHTKKSKRERARQGLYNASIAALGYKHVGGPQDPPVIVEDEAKIVRFAFEQYATGNFSDIEIAELLNAKGHKTRTGRRFSKDTVAQMLRNPFYNKQSVYRDRDADLTEISPGRHESIINDELWESCQKWRRQRRTASRSIQKKYKVYLLSGLVACDVCGRSLRAQSSKSGGYYRETSYERGYDDCPHRRSSANVPVLDEQIYALIEAIRLPDDWLEEVERHVGDDSELVDLQRQRDRLESERRRLQQMRISGDFDDNVEFYQAELDRVRRQLGSLPTRDQLRSLHSTAKSINSLYEVWQDADRTDQRDLLRLMLKKVFIDVKNNYITAIEPLAVFLPIFRQMPHLYEVEFGKFSILWNDRKKASVLPLPAFSDGELDAIQCDGLLPFAAVNPFYPPPKVRNAPAVSDAMKQALKDHKNMPQQVCQIKMPGWDELPIDTRKWAGVNSQTIAYQNWLDNPGQEKSLSVVVSQGVLWQNTLAGDLENEEMLTQIKSSLAVNGVWYLVEPLPVDSPVHWLHRFFPATYEWSKWRAWSMRSLFLALQKLGFSSDMTRHYYFDHVSLGEIRAIADRKQGPLSKITHEAFDAGLSKLDDLIGVHGGEYQVYSDFALLEGWVSREK